MFYFNILRSVIPLIFLATLAAVPAQANDATPTLTEDEAFAAVFENPGDLMLNFQLVVTQLRHQNFKGAIATLERILSLSRNNSQAQALLAGAQFRLGNIAEARRMAEILLRNPLASETEKAEISELLALIDDAEQAFDITGVFTLGGGIADNPEGGSIGNRSVTGFEYSKRADAHSFLTTSVALNITGNLVAQLPENFTLGISASQRDMMDYDLGDITSLGLSGRYLKTFADHQVTVLGAFLTTSIDDRTYLDTSSIQVTDTYIPAPDWALATTARLARNSFHNSFDETQASKPSGKNSTVSSLSWRVVRSVGRHQVGAMLDLADSDARLNYHAKTSRKLGADFSTPIFGGIMSVGLGHEVHRHKAGNPSFMQIRREDETISATVSYTIGLTTRLPHLEQPPRLSLSMKYGKTSSNIDEFSKYAGDAQIRVVQPF